MNMKIACSNALAELTREEVPNYISEAYGGINLEFGRDYLIPKPFDKRVFVYASSAVAKAAIQDGVAKNLLDVAEYRKNLEERLKRF